jgi:hypothetical protein
MESNTPNVYVLNRGPHDYSKAQRFGRLVYMSDGMLPKFNTGTIFRMVQEFLSNSQSTDYIVLSSLSVLQAIASAYFTHKHGVLNLLIFKDGDYVARTLKF